MITVEGKGNISAKVIADSLSEGGQRITTYELEYPRFIHSEFMTHRQFSRNAASSRAIPIKKMIEQVENNPAMPIHWGKNQSGMQAKEEVEDIAGAIDDWQCTAKIASKIAEALSEERDLHKQIVNRILEPFQMIKVVCTATEYENFFYLRNHADAQPEIAELARCMKEAMDESTPLKLSQGEWHLPYISSTGGNGLLLQYYTSGCDGTERYLTPEDAIKLSASLCAQVSYRKSDESIEKALKIYDMLVNMKPVHASPFEHQATPMNKVMQDDPLWEGITHFDKQDNAWSGNFKGWVQNRQLIKGHVYDGTTSLG